MGFKWLGANERIRLLRGRKEEKKKETSGHTVTDLIMSPTPIPVSGDSTQFYVIANSFSLTICHTISSYEADLNNSSAPISLSHATSHIALFSSSIVQCRNDLLRELFTLVQTTRQSISLGCVTDDSALQTFLERFDLNRECVE